MNTTKKSFRFSQEDIKMVSYLKNRLRLSSEIDTIRFCLVIIANMEFGQLDNDMVRAAVEHGVLPPAKPMTDFDLCPTHGGFYHTCKHSHVT